MLQGLFVALHCAVEILHLLRQRSYGALATASPVHDHETKRTQVGPDGFGELLKILRRGLWLVHVLSMTVWLRMAEMRASVMRRHARGGRRLLVARHVGRAFSTHARLDTEPWARIAGAAMCGADERRDGNPKC